jgi:NitT/TauT family transport system ATP-binding protein
MRQPSTSRNETRRGRLDDAMSSAIRLRGVSKIYMAGETQVRAIENVSLEIRGDSFVSLIGPSGCGKSTILKLLAGLTRSSAGVIEFWGKPILGINTQVGYVTQDHNLYPWLTLQENVEFPLLARGIAREERQHQAGDLIRMVGLAGFENAYPYELSGGMQKRGSIIRTLIYDPGVILMDEPFGPLDAQTRLVMQQELLDLWARKQKTILFVTHDLAEAITLSDRVVVMTRRPGQIKGIFDIPLARPRDVFTIHESPEFHEIYKKIWHSFRDEIRNQVGGRL